MIDAVALGEILIDFAPVGTDKAGYPTVKANPGGAPANFLAAMNACGVRTAMLGKVGEDAFGALLVNTLASAGIETRGVVRDENVFTTLAFVTIDDRGDRSFSFARKPGADTRLRFDEVDTTLIDEARVFHFGTLSLTDEPARSTTYRCVEYAKAAGKLISYDPNLRRPLWRSVDEAKEQMLRGLALADVVKISDEEAEFLFALSPEDSARHILAHYEAKLVFVTCGAEGCVFANRNALGRVPSLSGVHAVDTTGAGDIFGGSAMAGLLASGKRPEELNAGEMESIAAYACAAAGLSTESFGGISSVPEKSRVLATMEKRENHEA